MSRAPQSSGKGSPGLGAAPARPSRWQRFLEESSFLREYLWKYRRWVAIGLLALITVDILEVLPPLLLKWAVDAAVERQPASELLWIAGVYFAVALAQAVCRYGWRMYLIRSSLFAGRDLRGRYAHHLFGLSMSFYDRRRVGDLMSLATNDVEAVRMALGAGLLTFADALFYFMTVPVAMYMLSPELTLLAFVPLPIIPLIVARNEKEIHDRFEKVQEGFGKVSALAQEALSGVRVTKAFAKEHAQMHRMGELGREFIRLNLNLARVDSAFGPTLDFAMSLGLVLLLYFGGRHLIEGGPDAVTLGTFVAFQRYIQKMVWPMAAIGMSISMYQRAVTSSGRLKEILKVQTDVPQPATSRRPQSSAGASRGAIEFRHLSFGFPGAEKEILRGISLSVEPGERVAFVGAIGSGKSALLALLPRIYPVKPGMLFVDGIDINEWDLRELRAQVGYVSQDIFLFSETVLENVAYGLAGASGPAIHAPSAPSAPSSTASWLEAPSSISSIEQATQMAAVHDDVLGLVGSYRTRLGERGVNLSGGQKQRLTIARALAKQPSILVLDDALSSVDVQTEERILQGLRARPGRNTEIIAAHRISTIKDADRIVVLRDGAIDQQGTHRELIRDRGGIYYRFYEQQQLKSELESYVEQLDHAPGSGVTS
jgi:ATP-binding cassette subfamily B multidrug efflux pump